MFVQTWIKYLPVLRILLKRSANGEQTLSMNASDFQRAAGGRKIKFSFSITFRKGRLQTMDNPNPPAIAKDLAEALQQDDIARNYIGSKEIEFSLSNDLQLHIKDITPSVDETAAGDSTETSTEE